MKKRICYFYKDFSQQIIENDFSFSIYIEHFSLTFLSHWWKMLFPTWFLKMAMQFKIFMLVKKPYVKTWLCALNMHLKIIHKFLDKRNLEESIMKVKNKRKHLNYTRCTFSHGFSWTIAVRGRYGHPGSGHSPISATVKFDTTPGGHRVIILALIIGIKKLFEPLQKFEIVLKTAFNEFVHRYNLHEEKKAK